MLHPLNQRVAGRQQQNGSSRTAAAAAVERQNDSSSSRAAAAAERQQQAGCSRTAVEKHCPPPSGHNVATQRCSAPTAGYHSLQRLTAARRTAFWMSRLNRGLRLFPSLYIVPMMQVGGHSALSTARCKCHMQSKALLSSSARPAAQSMQAVASAAENCPEWHVAQAVEGSESSSAVPPTAHMLRRGAAVSVLSAGDVDTDVNHERRNLLQ